MFTTRRKSFVVLAFSLLFLCCNQAYAQSPTVTSISPTSGPVGAVVAITGTNFGTTQGSSTVSLNGTSTLVMGWSATTVVALVPSGATSGTFSVTVSSHTATSSSFSVTPLPSGWTDADVGSVGVAGSASYANGTFTVNGSGQYIWYSSDEMNFAYQALSGDGTIVARIASLPSGGSDAQVGAMIRETLDPDSANAFVDYSAPYSNAQFLERSSTGANISTVSTTSTVSLPYWVKLIRSGNTFSAYTSSNGVSWTQLGSNQTITMATNVYIGIGLSSDNNSSLATATFDNVSISSASAPAPTITGLSSTTGSIGSQAVISGSGFGDSQGGVVLLNDGFVAINSWSDTSITITIPSGATSGPLVVSVAPSMNDSNAVAFTVTSQPLPSGWSDGDVGSVGVAGSAGYASGTFTVGGSGQYIYSTSDAMHFAYQSLSGDGTIVARVVSLTGGGSDAQAGVMIRETLDADSTNAFTEDEASTTYFFDRTTTGGSTSYQSGSGVTLPYWMMLVRSGNVFSAYTSSNGLNWVQLGSSETITMADSVYIGLAVSSDYNSSLATATFDNVSISSTATPAPAITSLSATTGSVGNQVLVSGSGFGATQGSSIVSLNAVAVTVNSWSSTSISITIPSGATSGFLVVSLAPTMNDSNPVVFTVTTQPLPSPWVDQDVGFVGLAGSASYSTGTFTVNASGQYIYYEADGMHFVYLPLSGDGTIIARVVTFSGGSSSASAGIMFRETLGAGATNAYLTYSAGYSNLLYDYRPSTGANTSSAGSSSSVTLPYWIKLVRSSGTFTGYSSPDGSTWTQVGSSESISMAENALVGMAVSSNENTSLSTATFDNVSITTGLMPLVTSISPTSGTAGQFVTIYGTSFGSTQGTSTVTFNGTSAASITSWSNTEIVAVAPSTVTTGPVVVTVSSVSSNSNVIFTANNPVISSLTPPAAAVGDQITLTGYGFGATQGSGNVKFNGTTAGYVSWNDTSVTVSVLSGSTTGPATLTMNGVTSNGVTFTVLEALSVTSTSPTYGAVGSSVTITGTGFGATQSTSTAYFNGAVASITSWSDTAIDAVVPSGASTGPVSVEVGGVVAYGPSFQINTTISLTDSLGNPSSYTSEIVGGKWYVSSSTGSGCSTCTIRGAIQRGYDGYGNVTSLTDELGYVTSYSYDSSADVTSIVQPAIGGTYPTTTFTYNSFGEVLTMSDPLGHVTTNTYDSNGNLLTVTTPVPQTGTSASVTHFAYNSLGELTQITDPLSRATTITYTSAGLIHTITDPQSNVTTYAYDSRGNRTSITDALSHVTAFAYDSGNRLTTITYPDSTTSTFTYDYRGRRVTATDQNGKTTSYAYDDADRLTSVTDTSSNVTTYAYDTESNLVSITDANSHETSFSYDAYGRVTQTTFPSTHVETYEYDADNNLTSRTDRKGQTILYVYDALNRLTQKTYPDSTTAEYTYDLVSKVLGVTDPSGTYGFSYDNMGRLTGTTAQYSFLSSTTFTNAYTYDADSNRTGYTAPDSSTNTYSYDTLNRLATLANSWAGSFGFSYDALGRRTQMTRPNSVTTNYTYDNLSRLTTVLHQLSGSTIDGAAYTLDSAGNRTAKTDELASVTSNYSYDAIYELTGVTQGSTTTESYTYDPVGNRTASLGVSSYTTNSSNEMTANSNGSYSYDYNGNTTTKTVSSNTTSYSWDYENRLATVTLPGTSGTVTFKYDPFGRRIYKESPNATSIFLYDGESLVQTVNSSGGLVAHYAQGQNIDEPLAVQRGTTIDYFEADGLGSITSLTATNGTVAQSYTYDSFGNTTNSSGSLTNFFRYTAREFDSETNLYYYRARYFDPSVGKFISEDPVGFGSGMNFYRYSFNNPILLMDSSGLSATSGDECGKCPSSPSGWGPHTVGITASGTVAAGAGSYGSGVATGSVSGVWSPGQGVTVLKTGGAGGLSGKYPMGVPNQGYYGHTNTGAAGSYYGVGVGLTLSNAVPCQLLGSFKTLNYDLAIPFLPTFSVSLAFGANGIWEVTFSPGIGAGFGGSVSAVNTNTTAW
jgi:RHS repeat-associated protein